ALVFVNRRWAICAAAVVAASVVWLWRSGGVMSRKRSVLLLATAAAPWLVAGTSAWVDMNGYVFRYMYPTLMMAGVGGSAVLASLFAARSSELSAAALAGFVAVAAVSSGSPSLARIEHHFDAGM